jgi:hypothetical protein
MTKTAQVETDTALPLGDTPPEKAKTKQVATRIEQPPVRTIASPLDIVQAAMNSGNVEMYKEAVALYKEMDGLAARKAFDNAMADARAEIPVIRKDRRVGFDSKKVGATRTDYAHESLAEIARTIDKILSAHGLSYRFRVSSEINQPVKVTCIISHRDGHFEETSLQAGRDDSGNKNAIQQVGSTVTYLQRYTLKAALGLSAAEDDDGKSSEPSTAQSAPPPGSITHAQADQIMDLLDSKGASRSAFLQWFNTQLAKAPYIEHIHADHFDACIAAISRFKPKAS